VERSAREVIRAMMHTAGVEMDIEVEAGLLRKTEQRGMVGIFARLQSGSGWRRPEIPSEQNLVDARLLGQGGRDVSKSALITGITGQEGAYLSRLLLAWWSIRGCSVPPKRRSCSDSTKARQKLGGSATMTLEELMVMMVDADMRRVERE
jgi:hypothetical protein